MRLSLYNSTLSKTLKLMVCPWVLFILKNDKIICLPVTTGSLFSYCVSSKKLIILSKPAVIIFMIPLTILESRISKLIGFLSNTNQEWSKSLKLPAMSTSPEYSLVKGGCVDQEITSRRNKIFHEPNLDA